MAFKDLTTPTDTSGPTVPPMMPMAMAPHGADVEATDMLVNYNDRFASADPTLFRDDVIAQTLSVLIGKSKPNALLVGSAGVGKTRIVEDIARRIATGDATIPPRLANATIYELPLSAIVSGSGIVGELESKVEELVAFAEDPDNDAIIFIDEIHQLIDGNGVYARIAQILKPALARGDMRTIGATTLQEAQDLMSDPAFSRRFTRVIVDELTQSQTTAILESAWPSFVKHYQGQVTLKDDDTFSLITAIADQYATTYQHRPDSALTLLDRACADSIIARNTSAVSLGDPALAQAMLTSPIALTERRIRNCAKKLATGQSEQRAVDEAELDEALAEIHGQDHIVSRVKRLIQLTELNLFPRTRPLTVLCAGPSGCGKSAIARIVAKQMTGTEPITLNMTEYNSPASVNRIIGSPAGYVGSDSHAELPFDTLESNPYQVILLDEMEKCDKSVQRLFMSAFDDGYIKTARGKVVDFSKCVIFVTTNASHSTGAHHACGFTRTDHKSDTDTVADLTGWFDVEFLNRFRTILSFNPISIQTYRDIVADKYERHMARILKTNPTLTLPATLDDTDLDEIVAKTYVPDFGARPAERSVQEYIESAALALP